MILNPPLSKYNNFYDIARFNLTWRINIILILVLPILALTLFLLNEDSYLPSVIGIILCGLMLFLLKTTKSYLISAKIFTVLGIIINLYTLIFYPDSYHFVDTMWLMIIILFTYFTLGKVWGTWGLIVSVFGVLYYLNFVLINNLNQLKQLQSKDLIALSINFIICFVIVAYLINQFIRTSKYAEDKYKNLTDTLTDTNLEKTILLKEIHHRVKNNLQVITSLLRLQSREITDEASQVIYQESINRVIAMSLIHEKIYQTKDLSKIDLEEYVTSLANDLLESYSVNDLIAVNIVSEVDSIKTKSLVPLALIFNELISNSLKYAFEKDQLGKLSIFITKENNSIVIVYKDNGKWIEPENPESFGLELIDSLTDQLSGSFVRNVTNGTVYTFNFNIENK